MFFFNPSTRSSVWEKPEELQNRADVDKLLISPDSQPSGNSLENLEFVHFSKLFI